MTSASENTPTILAIDTALDGCHVGLLRDGNITYRIEPMQRGQSERLVPLIDELLGGAGAAYADLDAIAVTTGPGSFTGTRIALAAAQAIALAHDIPLYGLTNLEAVAGHNGVCSVAIDTKRGEAFVQSFTSGKADGAARILTHDSCNNDLPKGILRTNISNLGGQAIDLQEMIGFLIEYAQKQYFGDAPEMGEQVKPTYLRDAETSKSKIKYRKISK